MTEPVVYQTRDNIALIILNSPPVNALSQVLRQRILDAYRKAAADDGIQAVVIASGTGAFCGGADISEFASGGFYAEPLLPAVLDELEESAKPVVAAINGVALGGGLELALACDYRIAEPSAKLGFPEVHLGLTPGAGGTQRLPRFAGPQNALEIIVSGTPVSAAQGLAGGFLDRTHEEDVPLVDAAVAYAKELLQTNAPLRSCARMTVDSSGLPDGFFTDFRAGIARKTHGFFAPERCIQAVEAACNLPLAEGLKKEAELFAACMATPQARAQQHLFFAERAAARIPGVDPKAPPRKIEKVAIVGSGTMGGGIAMNFANAGMEVVILDLDDQALQRGLGTIRRNYEISAKKGKLSADQVEQRLGLLKTTTDYSEIADADLVIEAVFEKMDLKKRIFQTLDEVCKPGSILATNTSTLDVDEIASAISRPQDVVGLHFFSPANVMRLLEVVRGKATAEDVIVTVLKIAKRIRKVPVVVGVSYGFVGNRLLEPYGREAARLVLEGATPAQVDRVLTDFGLAMGFCSMADLAGIDVGYLARQGNLDAFSQDPGYAIVCDRLYERGDYGQKTSRGFYCYEGRDKSDNPDVVELAKQAAAELNIEQRQITDQEILERCIFVLINEGAQVLDEGIAYRSGDIDLVYINGYGFPAWRGGPMQYADEIGLKTILDALNAYRQQLGDYGQMWFEPAPLLEKLATEGRKFKDYLPGVNP